MSRLIFRNVCIYGLSIRNFATYKQGYSPFPDTREYFYFVNHQGQVNNG